MRVLCTSQLRLVSLNISYTSKLLILSNSIGLDSFIFKGFEDNWQGLQPPTFNVKSANFTCKCRGKVLLFGKMGKIYLVSVCRPPWVYHSALHTVGGNIGVGWKDQVSMKSECRFHPSNGTLVSRSNLIFIPFFFLKKRTNIISYTVVHYPQRTNNNFR